VVAELNDEGPVTATIWSFPNGLLLKKLQGTGKRYYQWPVDLRPLSSGIYVIRLDHANGKKYLRFVVK
jgi:hypothetical protein